MCLTYEKRFSLEMARRNSEVNGKIACDNIKTNKTRCNTSKLRNSPEQDSRQEPFKILKRGVHSPEPKDQSFKTVPLSTSPSRSHNFSPVVKATSPSECITKQYAGCKWTEPPSPSTLPHPPQHWMQSSSQTFFSMPFQKICQPEQDIAHQLKVLLKVQA